MGNEDQAVNNAGTPCAAGEFDNPGNSMANIAIGILCIDNYHEALDTLSEEKWPLLSVRIDRKLSAFCQNTGGILRKYEKDRYLLIISTDALKSEIEKKFDILDHIREINIGNTVPVTISIGIGRGGETLAEDWEFAKYALDLALGRGGDQVLIKDAGGCSFFGAKSSSPERGGSVRARVMSTALMQLIKDSANVYVMGHARADLDSLGSSVGICVMAAHVGKKCSIVLQESNPSIQKLYDKMIETREFGSLFITPQKALRQFAKNSLLVIVDAHTPGICECPELISQTDNIVVLDHHRKTPGFIEKCVLAYHEPYASSVSELVTEMIRYADGGLVLKPLEADALLAGITLDTKNFSIKTGARTFESAGFLRRNRADTIRVRKLLQNDMESFKARSEVVKAAQIFRNNIAISVCPHTIENGPVVAAMAADELLNIVGIQVAFVLTLTDLSIMISARSLGEINVQRIMEKLGGGGHQTVAGAQLPLESDMDIETAIQMIKDAINEYLDFES